MTGRFSSWLRFAVLSLLLFAGSPAFAATPAGLCSNSAQSVEAPPPVYPGHETSLDSCGKAPTNDGVTLAAPESDERPLPSAEPAPDQVKAPPVEFAFALRATLRIAPAYVVPLPPQGRDPAGRIERPPTTKCA